MILRSLILAIVGLSSCLNGLAGSGIPFGNFYKALINNDTNSVTKKNPVGAVVANADSNRSTINNSSVDNGFKDLFIANAEGINGARLNPKAVSFVQDYVEHNAKELQCMKDWGRPYFNLIDNILAKNDLPRELKYLAVIESQLKSNSKSCKGAVGPWQLMPATARLLGLKVNRRTDER